MVSPVTPIRPKLGNNRSGWHRPWAFLDMYNMLWAGQVRVQGFAWVPSCASTCMRVQMNAAGSCGASNSAVVRSSSLSSAKLRARGMSNDQGIQLRKFHASSSHCPCDAELPPMERLEPNP